MRFDTYPAGFTTRDTRSVQGLLRERAELLGQMEAHMNCDATGCPRFRDDDDRERFDICCARVESLNRQLKALAPELVLS